MEALEEGDFCFPHINNSCRWLKRPEVETTLIYIVLSIIILLTVVLNLLVIISISHFRQLQTTTNLLLLCMAVADFLVGLLQMPLLLLHNQGCWLLGDVMCAVHYFLAVSVGSMVLISVDRYVAICDPMLYTTRVTLARVKLCVCLCWIFSGIHGGWILRDSLFQPNLYDPCVGDCVVVIASAEGAVDLIVSFLAPILIIAILYLRVFAVAVSQARAMRSHIASVTVGRPEKVKVEKSELKAARTLGIVVMVFLLCSCPYYCFAIAAESNLVGSSSAGVELWFLYLNSSFNPVIYVFFYPWFRKAIKHIITLQILKPGSREISVL
uniref:G-protein coupled receptors family 1 profile domain-containing protein n=1 Tax=Cynoglossus semilaevis TaxID=244447 RepID=A0A3P8V2U8_CYNSE